MIKLIMADDESIILNGLKTMIDWSAYGMEVVATAKNGQQALDLIREHNPDLLITDIKMPFMDGLEVIQRAKELNPDLFVILISGYEDFKYAQNALQLKVFDYILKPISLERLTDILGKIQQEYIKLLEDKSHLSRLEQSNQQYKNIAFKMFFRDIMYQNIEPDLIDIEKEKFQYEDSNFFYAIIIAQLDKRFAGSENASETQRQKIKYFYQAMEAVFVARETVIFPDSNSEYVICISDQSGDGLGRKIDQYIAHFYTAIDAYRNGGKIQVNFGVGNIYQDLAKIAFSYREAQESLQLKFIREDKKVIYFSDVEKTKNDDSFLVPSEKHTQLLAAINDNNTRGIKSIINGITAEIQAAETQGKKALQYFVGAIISNIIEHLNSLSFNVDEFIPYTLDVYENILSKPTLSESMSDLYDFLIRIAGDIDTKKKGDFNYYIEKAAYYIKDNYMDTSISLDQIARYSKMSPNYFSMEFKRIKGDTYINYLTTIRMEKAKDLLKTTHMKINEISKAVGYENPTYFSSLFKKLEKMTPLEYRQGRTKSS